MARGLPIRGPLRIRHSSAWRVFPKSPAKFHDRIESFDSLQSHDFASKIEVKRRRRAGSMLVFGKLGSGLAGWRLTSRVRRLGQEPLRQFLRFELQLGSHM